MNNKIEGNQIDETISVVDLQKEYDNPNLDDNARLMNERMQKILWVLNCLDFIKGAVEENIQVARQMINDGNYSFANLSEEYHNKANCEAYCKGMEFIRDIFIKRLSIQ